ncbi:hypothetical protein [Paraburkholderia fungorum]|uniref:Uncharacterized protein n=1 Tax=Paraburkholderia fungorum TaxID=134537 RepID=A0A3R7HCD5_9BURK|nr:hypothetical protein [Paraburkholderia fungorum]RKF33398.1 hypothetical protein BCY88_10085 [Paraburkholderia fungorum]
MTDLAEKDLWEPGIRQFETSDSVMGGPDGVDNIPPRQLANRTVYLRNRIAEILGVSKTYVLAGGTANAITASYTPAVPEVVDGQVFRGRVQTANKGATTFTPNPAKDGIAPSPVYGLDGQPLSGGEIVGKFALEYDSTLNDGKGGYVLTDNPGGIRRTVAPAASDNSNAVPNTSWIRTLISGALSVTGLSASGKVDGANCPNLLRNGSAEFGALGWTMAAGLSALTDTAGATGTYFGNPAALVAVTQSQNSEQVPVSPNVALSLAYDVNTSGVNAGTVQLVLNAYNSSNELLSAVKSLTIANGTASARYSITGTTPAKTAYVKACFVLTGVSASVGGIAFTRGKLELGSSSSLYSNEAGLAFLQFLIGNFKGAISLSTSSTIPANQVGYEFQTSVGGITSTLPHPSTVSAGSLLPMYNNSTGTQTLSVPGGNFNSAFGSGTSVIVLPPNACVILVSDNTSWNGIGGAGAVGSAVKPTNTAGVGQWTSLLISAGTNGAMSLPPGGTWAYFYFNQTTAQSGVGIAAGGTVLLTGAAAGGPGISQASGFCWRIAQ